MKIIYHHAKKNKRKREDEKRRKVKKAWLLQYSSRGREVEREGTIKNFVCNEKNFEMASKFDKKQVKVT